MTEAEKKRVESIREVHDFWAADTTADETDESNVGNQISFLLSIITVQEAEIERLTDQEGAWRDIALNDRDQAVSELQRLKAGVVLSKEEVAKVREALTKIDLGPLEKWQDTLLEQVLEILTASKGSPS